MEECTNPPLKHTSHDDDDDDDVLKSDISEMLPQTKPTHSKTSHHHPPFFSSLSTASITIFFILLTLSLLIILLDVSANHGTSSSWISTTLQWRRLPTFSASSALNLHEGTRNRPLKLVQEANQSAALITSPNGTNFFHQSNGSTSPTSEAIIIKRYTKLEKMEAAIAKARSSIRKAAQNNSMRSMHQDPDYVPQGPIYRNANAFHRSYLEMEKLFRIYVYEEGDLPVFHGGPPNCIYSTEGRFIMEIENGKFYRTHDPDEALVYFLPFSIARMVQYIYVKDSHTYDDIGHAVSDYIKTLAHKYSFWNRSLGADHFMLACHDWGPYVSRYVPELYKNSIRVLCNANTTEGFNPSKDVSLAEINLLTENISTVLGGPSPSQRPLLAFFAGHLHGDIRKILLDYWKDRGDEDVQVYDGLPAEKPYLSMLRKSRFCLCPSGYEVASPRVVEAIYSECVPVLISDGYVPPFSDVLNWKAFSVSIAVKDIPNIKSILMGISTTQYLRLQRRVKQVQRHFVINGSPKRFDIYHMTVHSIWLRRLNVHVHD